MKHDPTEISGITLIDKILEFTSLVPDNSIWTFDELKNNKSLFVRLQQINSLLKLFVPESYNTNNLKLSIGNVLDGNFIRQRKDIIYKSLYKKMDEDILTSKYPVQKKDEWSTHELHFNYKNLIDYKITLNKVLNFNDGIMEISYPYLYSYIKTKSISNQIEIQSIDEFLSLVIDPAKRIIPKTELIRNCNYPNEDVYEIELDNW